MMMVKRRSACSPSVPTMKRLTVSKYAALSPRTGEDDGEWLLLVGGIQQDPDQVENLLGRAGAARKHDDAVREPHEGFQALLDVRHDRRADSRSGSAARRR